MAEANGNPGQKAFRGRRKGEEARRGRGRGRRGRENRKVSKTWGETELKVVFEVRRIHKCKNNQFNWLATNQLRRSHIDRPSA